jgi:copper/silver efflux system protein
VFGWVATGFDKVGMNVRTSSPWSGLVHTFPGMGKEFMPSLDEGAFLLMPTSMPHTGVEANKRYLQQLDMLITAIPEVEMVVGKAGRAETALDPAPMSMYENVIQYKSEYITDENGIKSASKWMTKAILCAMRKRQSDRRQARRVLPPVARPHPHARRYLE